EIKQLSEKLQPSTFAFSPSGRVLAASGAGKGEFGTKEYYEGGIHLWEVATGEPIRQIRMSQGFATALTFAPDGRSRAASGVGTIMLYNVTAPEEGKAAVLTSADLDKLWNDLSENAASADNAHWRLVRSAKEAVSYLKGRLAPVKSADTRVVSKLIADLDSK